MKLSTGGGTPETAVIAVVAVVAHHEELVRAQHDRAVVVPAIELSRVVMDRIWFVQLLAIDVYVAMADFQCLARVDR